MAERNIKKKIIASLAIIAAMFIYWWRFNLAERELARAASDTRLGNKVVVSGIVDTDPVEGDKSVKFVLAADDGRKYLITAGLGDRFHYGELVIAKGKLESPDDFMTQNGRTFDYVHYLAKDKIYYLIKFASVEGIGEAGNPIKKALFKIKDSFLASIGRILNPPESTLMSGLLLGGSGQFSPELNSAFIRTGTIHIVALSGFNVTIVAEAIMAFFKLFLPLSSSIALGIVSIILFAVMTGGGSTVIRAGIMSILALVARATGRTYDATRALILAGIVMVLINPFILPYDVSFQLSFLATFGIIHLAPKMERYFRWLPKVMDLPAIASTTAAAYIFVLPFLLFKMGVLSVVALPVNILILPFIPMTMLFGFIASLLGLASGIIALPFSFIAHILLGYELGIIKWFSSLRFAALNVGLIPAGLVILVYVIYAFVLDFNNDGKNGKIP